MEQEELSRWIFGSEQARRYTQDSPVLPDVWLAYWEQPEERIDLLLTPHAESNAATLAGALAGSLGDRRADARLAYSESYVVAALTFDELIREVIPLSVWWERLWPPRVRDLGGWAQRHLDELADQVAPEDEAARRAGSIGRLAWFVGLIGCIAAQPETWDESRARDRDISGRGRDERRVVAEAGAGLLSGLSRRRWPVAPLWVVSRNRRARTAVWRSATAVKADAARRVFDISCQHLRWAIIDTGVDATHPAFRRRRETGALMAETFGGQPPHLGTRVVATYDFTRLRDLVAGGLAGVPLPDGLAKQDLDQIEQRLRSGRAIDWGLLAPMLQVPHGAGYTRPTNEHGTHVAGILAGDWRMSDPDMPANHDLCGVCPDIELYDLRAFDETGHSEEFAISAALQFVRHLNTHSDLQVIHGVNLSFSIAHDVTNYAVGRTPVCDECDRLVGSGVVVVAAAGNEGRADEAARTGVAGGYRTVSVTDPGNAERVITVGATHRHQPHTYGVSYFSSRGPTGDGRAKPDLVAPGEKIDAPVPGEDYKAKDGTSQAAPHVSGAAALLLARHDELLGQPLRVKEVLCTTATDLGRERYFQGAGMVDVLRAIQSL